MHSLKNKTVFITGASSGIGAACAEEFARQGARLLLCARRIDRLNLKANKLKSEYGIDIHVFPLDVRKQKDVQAAIENLPKEWNDIYLLLNNAGLARGFDLFHDADLNDWEEMIDTNVKGLLYVSKAVIPGMIARGSGHIINIGSIAGRQVYQKGNVYCATKHAVGALTQALRLDLSGTPIRVSTVDPGLVETEFSIVRFRGDKTRADKTYEGMTPLTPADIADAVIYCASRPPHVNIQEVLIMPTDQASVGLVNRRVK
jgi:3-hydroxy acid dehydrogenase / malonic semialdehyde reductase